MDGLLMENPIKMNDLGVPSFKETPSLFKRVIANCVIFNDSNNDLSFFPNGNTNPTRKSMWERNGGSMERSTFLILGSTKGLYPKQLLKNTIWLRWMPFFSCFFFGNKKTCTPNGKTHSCKGFSVPHVFCVNGLVDFHCHHIPSFVYGVLYFGGELWLSNFSLNSGIEDGVFAGCEQLEEVTFPTSLTHLGNYAFAESGTEETQLARTGKMYEFIDFSLSILVPYLIFVVFWFRGGTSA